jgi:hypothetical protein
MLISDHKEKWLVLTKPLSQYLIDFLSGKEITSSIQSEKISAFVSVSELEIKKSDKNQG